MDKHQRRLSSFHLASVSVVNDSFSFKLSEVVEDSYLPWEEKTIEIVAHIKQIPLHAYPEMGFDIRIACIDGAFYLQQGKNGTFYEITDEFEEQLRANGYIN